LSFICEYLLFKFSPFLTLDLLSSLVGGETPLPFIWEYFSFVPGEAIWLRELYLVS